VYKQLIHLQVSILASNQTSFQSQYFGGYFGDIIVMNDCSTKINTSQLNLYTEHKAGWQFDAPPSNIIYPEQLFGFSTAHTETLQKSRDTIV
jgi:hypothetical protein